MALCPGFRFKGLRLTDLDRLGIPHRSSMRRARIQLTMASNRKLARDVSRIDLPLDFS
jgi:hypothetical protein